MSITRLCPRLMSSFSSQGRCSRTDDLFIMEILFLLNQYERIIYKTKSRGEAEQILLVIADCDLVMVLLCLFEVLLDRFNQTPKGVLGHFFLRKCSIDDLIEKSDIHVVSDLKQVCKKLENTLSEDETYRSSVF